MDESKDAAIRASMPLRNAALVRRVPWAESADDPAGCDAWNTNPHSGCRNVVLHAVTPCDDASRLVTVSTPRLAVLFGPRRGVTRELHQRLLVGRGVEADLQLIDEKFFCRLRMRCRPDDMGTSTDSRNQF